jgi:hypothetical protein
MPLLSAEQRKDAWKVFTLIKERDFPSNNTAERLVERSGLPLDRVLAALELLWAEDEGFIRVDVHRQTGQRGYFVDPKAQKKTPLDLENLTHVPKIKRTPKPPKDDDDEDDEDDDEDDEDEDDDDED